MRQLNEENLNFHAYFLKRLNTLHDRVLLLWFPWQANLTGKVCNLHTPKILYMYNKQIPSAVLTHCCLIFFHVVSDFVYLTIRHSCKSDLTLEREFRL